MFLRLILSVLLLITSVPSVLAGEEKADQIQPKGYVNDFASVIDASTKNRLTTLCTELDRRTHAQIAVVTIETLGGASINEYATSLFNLWGVGYKDDNRGIMILLSVRPEVSNRNRAGIRASIPKRSG